MRFPRVRMSLGSLIILVVVASVNCAVLRWIYDVQERGSRTTAPGEIGIAVVVGCLPLINIAIAGGMRFAFRSIGRGRGQGSESSRPAAMTFFCWHFLALIFVAAYFIPEVTQFVVEVLELGLDFVSDRCESILDRCNAVVTDYIYPSVLLGIGISGPVLLISALGVWLARRTARKLPAWRFRVLSALVSLCFVGTGFAIAATIQTYNEQLPVTITIHVIDARTRKPIDAGLVRILDPFDRFATPPEGSTSPDGRADVRVSVPSCGERNAYQIAGEVSFWGRWIEVSAPGYPIHRVPLADVLGSGADFRASYSGQVALSHGPAVVDAFGDIAGRYDHGFAGGLTILIEADGRYSWQAWGCTSHSQGFGRLARHGNELHVEEIPYVGRPIDPRQQTNSLIGPVIRAVPWGERTYLAFNDFEAFQLCRTALRSLTGAEISTRGHFLRQADREKPHSGFPKLSAGVWVAFLADEVSLANEDGLIRSGLESLLPETYQARNRRYANRMLTRLTNS